MDPRSKPTPDTDESALDVERRERLTCSEREAEDRALLAATECAYEPHAFPTWFVGPRW